MKNYQYVARDLSGSRKVGYSQAASTSDVLNWLREQGFTPVSVNEVSGGAKGAKKQARGKTKSRGTKSRGGRIKSADLSALCWQLTTMVEGGIPITTALETIAEDIENKRLQSVLEQVLEKMQKGETLSDSISGYPGVFNQLARAIVLAGETGGMLSASLRRLAEYYDNRDKLAKKVKGATAYPAFVLTFIVAIVVFIMAFIIPRFKVIFDQFGGELPAFTQGFMTFYDLLRHNLFFLIAFLMLVILMVYVAYTKSQKGHYVFSKMILSLPMLGKVYSQAFIATFCTTMATLLSAGVSVLEVFDILSGMTNNDIIKDAIICTRERIVGGLNIHLSMTESGFFPNLVIKMIQVGEESGSLNRVLERTADYYERKVDSTITTLMSLLEPVMIITVGAIVLVIVLALYLPIFTMSDVTG
ncbi:MAG: type II secretion system F family protein [Planctomycetota bacterium]|jgi:type IV pilus assembly protein PilC